MPLHDSDLILFRLLQMGKRKFHLSVGRKNEERKRWAFYPVRIPLNAVSVLNVSQYIIYAAIMFLMVLGLLVLTAVLANGTSCDPTCKYEFQQCKLYL